MQHNYNITKGLFQLRSYTYAENSCTCGIGAVTNNGCASFGYRRSIDRRLRTDAFLERDERAYVTHA